VQLAAIELSCLAATSIKSPNMKEIAKAWNVSIATVDRGLRARSDVGAATWDRVLKKAAQLGCEPNIIA
jgi:DNA-binding LacI/PurR family transcriptional regulator